MNDDRFFDLAMKSIAGKATDSEQKELEAWFLTNPAAKAEFQRLRLDAKLATEALPLVNAMEAKGAELPGYARRRLQSKVKQTLGKAQTSESDEDHKAFSWGWRWVLGLAATAAVVVLVGWPIVF
jgi:anti-sigma factor RsiW